MASLRSQLMSTQNQCMQYQSWMTVWMQYHNVFQVSCVQHFVTWIDSSFPLCKRSIYIFCGYKILKHIKNGITLVSSKVQKKKGLNIFHNTVTTIIIWYHPQLCSLAFCKYLSVFINNYKHFHFSRGVHTCPFPLNSSTLMLLFFLWKYKQLT